LQIFIDNFSNLNILEKKYTEIMEVKSAIAKEIQKYISSDEKSKMVLDIGAGMVFKASTSAD